MADTLESLATVQTVTLKCGNEDCAETLTLTDEQEVDYEAGREVLVYCLHCKKTSIFEDGALVDCLSSRVTTSWTETYY